MSDNLNNTNPEEVVSDNITEEFPEKPFNLKKEVFEKNGWRLEEMVGEKSCEEKGEKGR